VAIPSYCPKECIVTQQRETAQFNAKHRPAKQTMCENVVH